MRIIKLSFVKIIIGFILCIVIKSAYGQTNSFPPDGPVGIGMVPAAWSKLDMNAGGINIGGTGDMDGSLHIKQSFGGWGRFTQIHPSTPNSAALNLMASMNPSGNYHWYSWGVVTSGQWGIQAGTTLTGHNGIYLQQNGNVGIGVLDPSEKLSVNGIIRAKEIKVETANWPDYVFTEDYKNMSLADLESFIKTNKHLPEVPSASTIEEEGLFFGEINKLLLKKLEENTLHLIEMSKPLQALKEEVEQLKALKELK